MHTTEARKAIAGEVRAALARDGRSAATLADQSGISRSSMSRKLRGTRSFYVEELVAIEAALDATPGTLLQPLFTAAAA